jgi:hypothetical protein
MQEVTRTATYFHRTERLFQPAYIPQFSSTGHPEHPREASHAFEDMLDDITGRIHYVSLLTEIGAILGLTSLHAIVLNPHYPDDLILFDIWENCNFRSGQYEMFFHEMIQQTQNQNLELVPVICDKCLT